MKNKTKGKLYIVPTPIGNLGDMTFRAVEILKAVKMIGAEDTRTSGKLLKHYEIGTPMFSYHKFNERSRVDKVLDLLGNGEDVAIITDAGTPGISDPSSILISEVLKNGFEVETLPGATAFVPAIVSSGINCDRFHFIGFLADKEKDKLQLLNDLKQERNTLIFYESPHRLHKFLNQLLAIFGDRKISIGRELSKLHETYYRTTLKKVTNSPEMITLKGEFVIVLEGAVAVEMDDDEISELLQIELDSGKSKKAAVKIVSENTGVKRNRAYELALKL
jgi:16S rRNA (cytidine1402-2'-O)-methyltransferase